MSIEDKLNKIYTQDKSKMNETIFMMALDSYRTRVKNDPNYKICAEDALECLAEFVVENDLLDTLDYLINILESEMND